MSGADLVVLALPTGDREQLQIEHAGGRGAAEALGLALPTKGSASGPVLATGSRSSWRTSAATSGSRPWRREHMKLGPAVLVPLGPAGNVRGVLTAGGTGLAPAVTARGGHGDHIRDPGRYRRSNWPSTAATAERLAVFEDRDRIARDLHDLVIQRLYATGMSLQGATSLIANAEAAHRVEQAVDALDETIRDIRSAIFSLQSRGQERTAGVRARILAVADEMTGCSASRPRCGWRAARSQVPGMSPSRCWPRCARRCRTPPGTRRPAGSM